MIKLDPLKTHEYTTDPDCLSLHTPNKLRIGKTFTLRGAEHTVKEVTKEQTSQYYKKHNYYEIKV